MNSLRINGILVLLFLLAAKHVVAQQTQAGTSLVDGKNNVYGTLGLFPSESWVLGAGNYERRIHTNDDKFISSLWAKIGSAYASNSFDNHFLLFGGVTALTGHGTSHLEMGLGFTYINELNSDDQYYGPMVNLGYRYQQPKGLLLRAGIGLPETIYVSVGIVF